MDETISPAALHGRIRAGESLTVLDVRDREAYDAWRIEGARVESTYVPYLRFAAAEARGEVDEFVADLDFDPNEPVVVVCARGETSAHAAELLRAAGVGAANLAGGMEAWADLYVAHDLPFEGGVVRQYERPATGCLAYLLASDGEALVVDPLRAFMDRYERDSAEFDCELRYAFDTHVHADHLSGVRELGERGAVPLLPASARERGLAFEAEFVEGGDTLSVGAAELRLRAAPGHTSELLVARTGDVLLSADALFLDGVGRPDLEGGDDGAPELAAQLYGTLTELFSLPAGTLVAPGHVTPEAEPAPDGTLTRTLGEVREAVTLGEKEAFVERVLDNAGERPANYERIIQVNLGRAEGEEELELGPNNCAVSSA